MEISTCTRYYNVIQQFTPFLSHCEFNQGRCTSAMRPFSSRRYKRNTCIIHFTYQLCRGCRATFKAYIEAFAMYKVLLPNPSTLGRLYQQLSTLWLVLPDLTLLFHGKLSH